MTADTQRRMFQSAAFFNWLACLMLLPATGIAAYLGFTPLMDNGPFGHMALMAIALFGYGYWMVSRDPVAHRGIIILGIIGKLGVVAVMFGHYFFGTEREPSTGVALTRRSYLRRDIHPCIEVAADPAFQAVIATDCRPATGSGATAARILRGQSGGT